MPDRIALFACTAVAIVCYQQTSAAAEAVSPAQTRVVGRIAEKKDWLADTKLCPADVMPIRGPGVHASVDECKTPPYDTCLAKCEAGSAGSCYSLAVQLQRNSAPFEIFESLFQRSCKLGVVSGCTNHAAGLLHAKDDVPTQKCAARTFERGCKADDPWACTMYGLQLSRGLGIAQDLAAALKVLEKSCKYGDSDPACGYAKELRKEILEAQSKKQAPTKKY